jgi:hypothetical protein
VATLTRPAEAVHGITLVTQTTRSKVRYLERALEKWGGPASIAFYAYTSEELAFFSNYSCPRCTISVVFGGRRKQAYPINLLRNVALVAAPTNLTFIFDTDFLPSPGLHDSLAVTVAAAPGAHRMAWVVPAFEIMKRSHNAPSDFSELRTALKAGAVGIFHGKRGGHSNTQIPRWLHTDRLYCLNSTASNYEPYLVINKTEPGFPLFDTKFVDRGMNKARAGHLRADLCFTCRSRNRLRNLKRACHLQVMWARQLKALGYRFCVVPRVWVVHVYESRPQYRPFYATGHGGKGVHGLKILRRHQVTGSSISLQLTPDTQTAPAQPQQQLQS